MESVFAGSKPNYLEQIDVALDAAQLESTSVTRAERTLVVRFRKQWSAELDGEIREIAMIAVTGATIDECVTNFKTELERYTNGKAGA